MEKSMHYLIFSSVLWFCFLTSCFESENQRLKAYNSDMCNEISDGTGVLFDGVPWGSSRDKVIAAKGKQPTFADDQVVVFDDHISTMRVNAVFYFYDNQLTRGKYVFTTQHRYENSYLDEFRDVEAILKNKYGDPAISDTTWTNTMFKYVQKDYGLAISLGHMSMLAGRKVGCVKFNHTLTGGNNQIIHAIEYYHLKMQSFEANAQDGVRL